MVQVRTRLCVLQGCEGQRLEVRVVDRVVTKKIPAADQHRSTGRLHSVSPHNYLQALINPCFIKPAIIREVLGGEPLGHVPLQLTAAAPKSC